MRIRYVFARSTVVLAVALFACLASARQALADPCTIGISFVAPVPSTHDYALAFSSTVDGVADLRWTMYAGDRAYTARFPKTAFTAKTPPSPRSIARFHSAPAYVRLPNDAAAPTAATVDLIDPDTGLPIACSGGRVFLGGSDGSKNDDDDSNDASVVAARENERRALAGAARATPTLVQSTDVAPLTCAKPFEFASVTKPFQAEYPPLAIARRETGRTFVLVEIAPTNAVVGTAVIGTSASPALDAAARIAAAKSTYRAERFRCDAVAGSYLFQVDFSGH